MIQKTQLNFKFKISQLIFILCILYQCRLSAQQKTEILLQPKISLNLNSDKLFSQNFSLAYRSFIYKDKWAHMPRQFDFSHFSALTLNNTSKVSLGVMYRYLNLFDEDISNEFRLIQQYHYMMQKRVIRLGHRFQMEERFLKSLIIFRFRYRFTIDFPLKGQRLDIGGLYSIINLEAVYSLNKKYSPQYDGRLAIGVGKLLFSDTKIQLLVEYRRLKFTASIEGQLFAHVAVNLKL